MAPVVQTLDSAIHRIIHYPADTFYGRQLPYLLDKNLSIRERYPPFQQLGPCDYIRASCSYREWNVLSKSSGEEKRQPEYGCVHRLLYERLQQGYFV